MKETTEVLEIIEALQAGTGVNAAFRQLFHLFYQRLVACFHTWGYDPDTARDLSQETLALAFRNIKGFRGESKLSTWLYKIAKHQHLNRQRRDQARKRDHQESSLEQMETGNRYEQAACDAAATEAQYHGLRTQERMQRLQEEIGRLPPRMRECLLLRVDQSCSYQEIADTLEIRIGTVKSHIAEARKLLRQRLEDDFDDIGF